MENDFTICPGCRVRLPDKDLFSPDRFNASGECWELHDELTAYNISFSNIDFFAQHSVDAYGAQHAGENVKPINTAFSLIGLYLAIEKGYTGRQIQLAHMELGRNKKITWPKLERPTEPGAVNISHVLQATPGNERKVLIKKWAASVWQAWEKEHTWTRKTTSELLNLKL
jgi:hypothetical protein